MKDQFPPSSLSVRCPWVMATFAGMGDKEEERRNRRSRDRGLTAGSTYTEFDHRGLPMGKPSAIRIIDPFASGAFHG